MFNLKLLFQAMNLNYKILWFEDDPDVINEDVGPLIRNYLIELGFRLDIVHHLNGEHIKELIKDRNFDFIVTDLNLGEHETGEVLIDIMREEDKILTEVLLYSANANEINQIVENKGWIERASFCVGLGNLANKMKSIIAFTIKKTQDVNNTRGLVIAETIDLERKIESILIKYFATAEETVLTKSKTDVLEKIHAKKMKKHKEDIEQLEGINFTQIKLLIDNDILTASNSFDAMHSILKEKIKQINIFIASKENSAESKIELEAKKVDLTSVKAELNNFRDEILKIRNTLAHVKEEIGEDGIPFLNSVNEDGTVIKFDSAKYIEIRKNLLKHNRNLDKIISHLE